ncbi:MAG: PQQ-binding-like beta-propeller repeat protein [Streptomycetaceae bacterium]|nr:PQQ-binding-like beta-propeller repeat protein [Streptomycetaceae bacterium]
MQPLGSGDPQILGGYRMLGRLGAGGMGRVYLARSPGGRTVAVKVVRAELAEDAEFRRRFRHEVEIARAVSGPYTAPVVDADTEGPLPWLATAYVLGPGLDDVIAQHGPLPEASVWALAGGLAEALRGIHGAGLVHRDLKPSNVLLAADGPRVIDFGIARAIDGERLTSTGVVVGSPGFMSPEQAMGRSVGPEGDVFSLGVVLAYSSSGQMPFSAGAPAALLYQVVHEEPDLSAIPTPLRAPIAECLAKDPAKRPTPQQIVEGVAARKLSVLRDGWLPGPVASTIAQHASRILDLDTAPLLAAPPPSPAPPMHARVPTPAPARMPAPLPASASVPAPAPVPAPALRAEAPSRRRFLTIAAVAGAVTLGGAGAAVAFVQGDKPSPTSQQPTSLWTYDGEDTKNQIVWVTGGTGGVVILPTREVTALSLTKGKQLWTGQGRIGGRQKTSPMFATADTLLAIDTTSNVIGINPSSGAQKWQWHRPSDLSAINAFVTADATTVYAFATAGVHPVLLSIDTTRPRERWRVPINASRSVGGTFGTVSGRYLAYTDDATNALTVRDTTDGRQLWSMPFTSTGNTILPAIAHGTVFITDEAITAYDLATGHQKWTKPGGGSFLSAPSVRDGVLYVGDNTTGVRALSAFDGHELWSARLAGASNGNDLVVTDNALYAASNTVSNGIYALDRTTGTVTWNFRPSKVSAATTDVWQLANAANRIIATIGGHVFALPAL